ncbi:hypothetical protein I79_021050 [Cricetulus griseus]|uniref:Uncharacterized protein n=1 Tax=Cricetulus griseus TaxID=10029 RepID=G3IBM4_CRIGR|nr:hypothetical protein I79_021050 [Cricetulus griseus]
MTHREGEQASEKLIQGFWQEKVIAERDVLRTARMTDSAVVTAILVVVEPAAS